MSRKCKCPRCLDYGSVELDRDYFRWVFVCGICKLRILAKDIQSEQAR